MRVQPALARRQHSSA